MLAYRTPGVYFEWLDSSPPAISAVRTDIAGFVGIAARGPLHEPMRVESWTQFFSMFGGHIAQGYLAYAVHGFFANGGRACYVVRAADPITAKVGSCTLQGPGSVLQLEALTEGSWSSRLRVRVTALGNESFSLALTLPDGTQERFSNLNLRSGDPRNAKQVLNDKLAGSRLVCVPDTQDGGGAAPPASGQRLDTQVAWLNGGQDGLATLRPEHLIGEVSASHKPWGLMALERQREVAIVAIPDIMTKDVETPRKAPVPPPTCAAGATDPGAVPPPQALAPAIEYPPAFTDTEILRMQAALISHCEQLKDRMAVLDPPSGNPQVMTPANILDWASNRAHFDTSFAALYYPWLRAPDPRGPDGALLLVPPSGHVAGIYAQVEARTGVHKPPANELIADAQDVSFPLDDLSHGNLNAGQVNVLRAYPGRGLRVAGARTLWRDSTQPGWRFVNVRRLFIMIERAIDQQTQWLVFEPNNPALWRELDRLLRAFLSGLWRQGMLDGATVEQAYAVRCDASTNPPEQTDAGRLTAYVGIQPPWPAEFVIARIGRTQSGTQITEE